jgi:hypothetical protein
MVSVPRMWTPLERCATDIAPALIRLLDIGRRRLLRTLLVPRSIEHGCSVGLAAPLGRSIGDYLSAGS